MLRAGRSEDVGQRRLDGSSALHAALKLRDPKLSALALAVLVRAPSFRREGSRALSFRGEGSSALSFRGEGSAEKQALLSELLLL
eukprot:2817159-Rhodomonas_salina.2